MTQTLWSVRETTDANNVVAFGLGNTHAIIDLRTGYICAKESSNVIVHKDTGLETQIRDTGREYLLDMWIKGGPNNNDKQTFQGQPAKK